MFQEHPFTMKLFAAAVALAFVSTSKANELCTSDVVRLINYDSDYQSDGFDYNIGWAGSGFGLSGTQRGAPEMVWIDKDSGYPRTLKFTSHKRTGAWYQKTPGASLHPLYSKQDSETQDDFFLYSSRWEPSNKPYFYGQFYIGPKSDRTSLRTPVIINSGTKSWPGIWMGNTNYYVRTFGGGDYWFTIPEKNKKPGWVTLGMMALENGDMRFFIKYGIHDKASLFLHPDAKHLNSALQGYSQPINKIVSQNDATIMLSQVMPEDNVDAYNRIAVLEYGHNIECR